MIERNYNDNNNNNFNDWVKGVIMVKNDRIQALEIQLKEINERYN